MSADPGSRATLGGSGWICPPITSNGLSTSTPTTGQTVSVPAVDSDQQIWLTPAGTIAALTLTLPADSAVGVGRTFKIGSSAAITSLTVNGATTIYNAPTSMAVGDFFVLVKVAANTWAKEQ